MFISCFKHPCFIHAHLHSKRQKAYFLIIVLCVCVCVCARADVCLSVRQLCYEIEFFWTIICPCHICYNYLCVCVDVLVCASMSLSLRARMIEREIAHK